MTPEPQQNQPLELDNPLWNKPITQWPTNTIATQLEHRYRAEPVPPCVVCGGPLSIAVIGGGEPTVWACNAFEDDPDVEGGLRLKAGRAGADQHYSDSRFVQRQPGDGLVLEATARLRVATQTEAQRNELLAALRQITDVDYRRDLAVADPTTHTKAEPLEFMEATDAVITMADIARTALAGVKGVSSRKCEWRPASVAGDSEKWVTACGGEFPLLAFEDRPADAGLSFCCFCGGELVEAEGQS